MKKHPLEALTGDTGGGLGFCAECGVVSIDTDNCCTTCEAKAAGQALDELVEEEQRWTRHLWEMAKRELVEAMGMHPGTTWGEAMEEAARQAREAKRVGRLLRMSLRHCGEGCEELAALIGTSKTCLIHGREWAPLPGQEASVLAVQLDQALAVIEKAKRDSEEGEVAERVLALRDAAIALLAIYDFDPNASDGPEADAEWTALRNAVGAGLFR